MKMWAHNYPSWAQNIQVTNASWNTEWEFTVYATTLFDVFFSGLEPMYIFDVNYFLSSLIFCKKNFLGKLFHKHKNKVFIFLSPYF